MKNPKNKIQDPQKPAQGIMLDRDFGDAKFYTISCNCGNPSDQIKLEIELDDPTITVHVWTTVKTDYWQQVWPENSSDHDSLFGWKYHLKYLVNALAARWRITWRVWTRGYVEMESWTLLDEQQAINLAWTLHESVKELQTLREERNKHGKV